LTAVSPDAGPRLWHTMDSDEVLRVLGVTPNGLESSEAERRLAHYGANRLAEAPARGPLRRFLAQFHNLFIYVLNGAAAVSALLGQMSDAAVILAVVLFNAVIGFVQEGRAERAMDAIRRMIDPRASVVRHGRRMTVPATDIVPGDIVLLEAGDRVPADLRLIRARNLKIEEAALTGESLPAEKATVPVTGDAPLGDRTPMAYSGTLVAVGQATGVVVATGQASELGRISHLLSGVTELETPLIRQMNRFARHLTFVILAVSVLAFLFAVYVRGYLVGDAFMMGVGLAVAAIPEGLPAILTIALAMGVQRMARRNAIIRHLPAVETLGAVSVICTDKTGTLTRNEMMAGTIITAAGEYRVSGAGYDPAGRILPVDAGADADAVSDPVMVELIEAALLCNDADLHAGTGGWTVEGDPMEGALIVLAHKGGLDHRAVRAEKPRGDEIPFDSTHRFMATLHHEPAGGATILIKGAPERVFAMCSAERTASGDMPIDLAKWHATADRAAAQGHRVLAFARKPAPPGLDRIQPADVQTGAVLLGCVGFIDPPRAEAEAAVRECRDAGIRVVMITGDHAGTAREIGRRLGLAEAPAVLTGRDVDQAEDDALARAVGDTHVFARTEPAHKLRLVEAFQRQGLTVAMTGDGVNDSPALKRADVGVAMGIKGTEAAKQAAKMVLADDNFASIVAAVREGRTVYDNVIKVIGWTLPTNGGEALTILSAIALGLALPITATQILWVNMVTAVGLGLTLAFEPTEPGTMRRPPRPRDQPILTGALVWQIIFVSVLFVAGAFGMFFWAEVRGLPLETARTMVVNTLVVMEVAYLFSVRFVHGPSLTWQGVLGTPAVLLGVGIIIVAQVAFTYLPVLQAVFDTRAVPLLEGMVIVTVGIALLATVECEKAVRRLIARRHG